jgi:hypothetical protein
MISDTLCFYGRAFGTIIDERKEGIHIRKISEDINCFYLFDERIPILLKHASKRTSPWVFSIGNQILRKYYELIEEYRECLVALICGNDGIATLSYKEIKDIIDFQDIKEQKRISVSRKLRGMYFVSASDGKMDKRISQNSLLEKIEISLSEGKCKE